MQKVFCIGFNKTGTTTLKTTFEEMGFKVAPQLIGERLMKKIKNQNFDGLLKFCEEPYHLYQDIPFSLPGVYKVLHSHFPNAKFILLTRDSFSWWKSIATFHKLKFSVNGTDLTEKTLKARREVYTGMIWDYYDYTFNSKKNIPLYDQHDLIRVFERHNHEVSEYFCGNPNFLSIDVSNPGDFMKLCSFLQVKYQTKTTFPHENRTSDLQYKKSINKPKVIKKTNKPKVIKKTNKPVKPKHTVIRRKFQKKK